MQPGRYWTLKNYTFVSTRTDLPVLAWYKTKYSWYADGAISVAIFLYQHKMNWIPGVHGLIYGFLGQINQWEVYCTALLLYCCTVVTHTTTHYIALHLTVINYTKIHYTVSTMLLNWKLFSSSKLPGIEPFKSDTEASTAGWVDQLGQRETAPAIHSFS